MKEVFLNFANYVREERELINIMQAIEDSGAKIVWVGTGPTYHDVTNTPSLSRALRMNEVLNAWRKTRVAS